MAHVSNSLLGWSMNLIEELRSTLRMEVRGNSRGNEYLEAVIRRDDLELLQPLLTKHFGLAAKEPGKQAALPVEIQGLVDSMGGLRVEQAFLLQRGGRAASPLCRSLAVGFES